MNLDLSIHRYRVFDRDRRVIGHLSSDYAAASHLYLHERHLRMDRRGGWVECPDGRIIEGRAVVEIHEAGIREFRESLESTPA